MSKFEITSLVKVRDVVEADDPRTAVKRFLAKYPATTEVLDVNGQDMTELAVIFVEGKLASIFTMAKWRQGQEEGHTYFTTGGRDVRSAFVPTSMYMSGDIGVHNIKEYL